MFRFIAILRHPLDSVQASASNLLERTLSDAFPDLKDILRVDEHGLVVLCPTDGTPGMKPNLMWNQSGVILGRIHKKRPNDNCDDAAAPAKFDSSDTVKIISSSGRSLINHYWGDYVAIFTDPKLRATFIIKDPTGNLPCFVTQWRGTLVAFSCLTDLIDSRLFSFSANWSYVVSIVGSGGYDALLKPLNEVSEIHRGECLTISRDLHQTRAMYWNPNNFADSSNAIDNVDEAASTLRAAVRTATYSLVTGHSRTLIRLSGGLDSSIVAGCLRSAPTSPKNISYTYYVPDARSDERRWARLAADFSHTEHLELEMDPGKVDLRALRQVRPSVTPVWAYAYLVRDHMERRLLNSHPHSIVFSGDGGDSGFGGECIAFAVDDFLRLRGASRGIVKLAAQVALRTDMLAWTVLAGATRRYFLGSSMYDYREKLLLGASLVSKNIRGTGLHSSGFPHPWFEECTHVPWHVINRLGNLIATPELYNPLLPQSAYAPYSAAPLYAQPVLEASLRIPVYMHFFDGMERSLARKAFQNDVPSAIIRRQWKDRAPGAFEELVQNNRSYLSEVLLDGALCREGVLDRPAVENALSGKLSAQQFFETELITYLHLENWLQHFTIGTRHLTAA